MPGFAGGTISIIEFLCSAVVGISLGRWVGSGSLGRVVDALVGGVGGLLFVWPSARLPGVARFVGHVAGSPTPTMLIGAAIAGLLGGAIVFF